MTPRAGTAKDDADDRAADRPALTPAATRALVEAAERRRAGAAVERPREVNGRKGPEPVRYGDWEKNGLISDF